jgi:hypothetical protein
MYKDVIHIHRQETLRDSFLENGVHSCLEGCWCATPAEGDHCKAPRTAFDTECGKVSRPLIERELPEPRSQIQFREDHSRLHVPQDGIHPWELPLEGFADTVEGTKISTDSEFSIGLPHDSEGSVVQGLARLDYFGSHHFIDFTSEVVDQVTTYRSRWNIDLLPLRNMDLDWADSDAACHEELRLKNVSVLFQNLCKRSGHRCPWSVLSGGDVIASTTSRSQTLVKVSGPSR